MEDFDPTIYVDFTIWKTRNGKKIPVKEMSDNHLLNTINMLKGEGDDISLLQEAWLKILTKEYKKKKKINNEK